MLVILLVALNAMAAPSASPHGLKIPKEVCEWIDRSHHCWQSKGWSAELEKYRCSELEQDERRLREKYRSHRGVIREIDKVVDRYNDVD